MRSAHPTLLVDLSDSTVPPIMSMPLDEYILEKNWITESLSESSIGACWKVVYIESKWCSNDFDTNYIS